MSTVCHFCLCAIIGRLIHQTFGVKVLCHQITVNETKKDLHMWQLFVKYHNGKTLFISQILQSEYFNLHTDVSGFACVAVILSGSQQFFQQWRSFNKLRPAQNCHRFADDMKIFELRLIFH